MQKRLPDSQTVKQLAEETVDYQQAVIDLEPIGQDSEFIKLLEEIRSVLASNQELNAKIEALIAVPGTNTTNIGKQVNIKQLGKGREMPWGKSLRGYQMRLVFPYKVS